MVCAGFSLTHICKPCSREHLTPSLTKRKILGQIPVYSFYNYTDIEPLLLTKHTDLGFYVYDILAKHAFTPFAEAFECEGEVAAVGIDEHVRHGYSHTALLARSLASPVIKPRHNILRAASKDTYSGQNYQYRLLHPRRFSVAEFKEEEVILVDDVITTGLTLTQAAETLHRAGKKVIACLTLADAEKKV